eukprot:Pgem_evm1s18571
MLLSITLTITSTLTLGMKRSFPDSVASFVPVYEAQIPAVDYTNTPPQPHRGLNLNKNINWKQQLVKTLEIQEKICTVQDEAPRHLGALSDSNSSYYYDAHYSGAGSVAYIMDTGIKDWCHNNPTCNNNNEFEGGLELVDFTGDKFNSQHNGSDLYGHGSHVAGIISSKGYGVAKKAKIVSLKFLTYERRISDEQSAKRLIEAFEFALSDWIKKQRPVAVISASISVTLTRLKGSTIEKLNNTISECVKAGLPVISSAGNKGNDVNELPPSLPSSNPNVIVVGSSSYNGVKSEFSNYGSRVNLYSYGEKIESVDAFEDAKTAVKSGTSQATPIVSGMALLLMGGRNVKADDLLKELTKISDIINFEGSYPL